jgi:hypothetical protein
MPLPVSSDKLRVISREFGYKGNVEDLSVEVMTNYVRKYYGLRDGWTFRGMRRRDINGLMMNVYEFDHIGRKVYDDKVIK